MDKITNYTPEELESENIKNEHYHLEIIQLHFNLLIGIITSHKLFANYIYSRKQKPIFKNSKGRENELNDLISIETRKTFTKIEILIIKAIENSWKYGETIPIADLQQKRIPFEILKRLSNQGLLSHRQKALEEFTKRRIKGLNLSQRIWRIENQCKLEIEAILNLGILDGRGARQIANDLKQNLIEPKKLFRRIRDAKENLILSEPARVYNPGQGVYRSSYKNALRLTRNEINKAYRLAQFERIQTLPFISGIEISLSKSHNELMPEGDICDTLKGIYPKDFKWSGWHVMCMCMCKTVLPSESELITYLNTLNSTKPKIPNQHKMFPDELKKWLKSNKERYTPGRLDWIDDNKAIIDLMN